MTDTEFRGYIRYHGSVEEPVYRERRKTADAKLQYAKKERRLSSKWKATIKNANEPAIEGLEADSRDLQRIARGIRTRQSRLKKVESRNSEM